MRWSRSGCFGFARGVEGDGWVGTGECRWLGHGGEGKKYGDAVATRAKPRATKTARRRGSSCGVGVPHAACVCARLDKARHSVKIDARALIG
jgi:hypothetical protein